MATYAIFPTKKKHCYDCRVLVDACKSLKLAARLTGSSAEKHMAHTFGDVYPWVNKKKKDFSNQDLIKLTNSML